MKPFIREYTNDEKLENDIQSLKDSSVDAENIYVISHDDDRTNRIAKNAGANTIGMKEMKMGSAISNVFKKKGDELRTKLKDIGFSQEDAENYEEKMDEGKVLLIVTNTDNPERYLV
ncbi:general stress protein [Aciduricibacillus chroicocephali]|uniref:General stress protein n=1 Tax=Aciduricibacillus chroicocephali TaxID=3054939 RepID=A0ABY9KXN5_9BACI|nr:general stress protein [Bacillaceae bacterium 44XB]